MATDTGFGKVKIFNDFLGAAVDETNDIVVGTENSGTQAVNIANGGWYRLVSGATSGNRVLYSTALNLSAASGELIGEVRLTNVTAITLRAIYAGFIDVIASTVEMPIEMAAEVLTSTASDACGFMYDTDSTNDTWYCVGVKADADATPVDSGIAPAAAGTSQTLRVVVNADGKAEYFIDGKYVGSVTNAITASTAVCFGVCLEARESAAKTLDSDYIYVEMGRT